jgi:ketosteroid isomerase-like protein
MRLSNPNRPLAEMEYHMAIELPEPIAGYFAADSGADKSAILRHFSDDAVVADEGKTHVGHDAIRSWVSEASTKYSYVVEPFDVATHSGLTVVTAHLKGNFPGSPVDLRYRFALDHDKITSLEIGV